MPNENLVPVLLQERVSSDICLKYGPSHGLIDILVSIVESEVESSSIR